MFHVTVNVNGTLEDEASGTHHLIWRSQMCHRSFLQRKFEYLQPIRWQPGAHLFQLSQKVPHRLENQAFRFPDKPIYCTQFHPELDRAALLERIRAYPWYAEKITGDPIDEFARKCHETTETDKLLGRFVHQLRVMAK